MTARPHIPALPQTLQQLSARQAHFCLSVEQFLTKELTLTLQGKTILVGCSGGVDSVALLLILYYLAPRLDVKLTVCTLNHGLRPESAEEVAFVQALSDSLNIPCHVGTIDVYGHQQGEGIEETARKLRYAFFEDLRQTLNMDIIAVGHHANDLAEDIVMRLIRGTGWPALGGMTAHDPSRYLLRPLLVTKKHKLTDFVTSLDVPWHEDTSNNDLSFLRNRIRATIIPALLEENPAFLEAAAGLWRLANIDDSYWRTQVHNSLKKHTQNNFAIHSQENLYALSSQTCAPKAASAPHESDAVILPKEALLNTPKALRLRMYKNCLETLGTGQPLLTALLNLDEAWLRGTGGKTVQFPGSKTATIKKKSIIFQKEP